MPGQQPAGPAQPRGVLGPAQHQVELERPGGVLHQPAPELGAGAALRLGPRLLFPFELGQLRLELAARILDALGLRAAHRALKLLDLLRRAAQRRDAPAEGHEMRGAGVGRRLRGIDASVRAPLDRARGATRGRRVEGDARRAFRPFGSGRGRTYAPRQQARYAYDGHTAKPPCSAHVRSGTLRRRGRRTLVSRDLWYAVATKSNILSPI